MGMLKWQRQSLNYRSEKHDLFFEGSVLLFLKKKKNNSNSTKTESNTQPLKGKMGGSRH